MIPCQTRFLGWLTDARLSPTKSKIVYLSFGSVQGSALVLGIGKALILWASERETA